MAALVTKLGEVAWQSYAPLPPPLPPKRTHGHPLYTLRCLGTLLGRLRMMRSDLRVG